MVLITGEMLHFCINKEILHYFLCFCAALFEFLWATWKETDEDNDDDPNPDLWSMIVCASPIVWLDILVNILDTEHF